jgi:hypothetical protein
MREYMEVGIDWLPARVQLAYQALARRPPAASGGA